MNTGTQVRRIDWEQARATVAASQARLEAERVADPLAIQAVLAQRGRALAARQRTAAVPGSTTTALVVRAGPERHAVPAASLVGVLPFQRPTRVPRGRAELLGVVGVRGEVRSVISLAAVLGLDCEAQPAGGYLLLARAGAHVFALHVDDVERFRELGQHELAPLSAERSDAGARERGATADGITLLDMRHVFAHPVFQGAHERAAPPPSRIPPQ